MVAFSGSGGGTDLPGFLVPVVVLLVLIVPVVVFVVPVVGIGWPIVIVVIVVFRVGVIDLVGDAVQRHE
jgi:hypothetical protein